MDILQAIGNTSIVGLRKVVPPNKDIASRVGASREMISRIFSDLAEGGYVRKEEGHLVIVRKPPPRW